MQVQENIGRQHRHSLLSFQLLSLFLSHSSFCQSRPLQSGFFTCSVVFSKLVSLHILKQTCIRFQDFKWHAHYIALRCHLTPVLHSGINCLSFGFSRMLALNAERERKRKIEPCYTLMIHWFWRIDVRRAVPQTLAKTTCLTSCASSWTVPRFAWPSALLLTSLSILIASSVCLCVGHLYTLPKIGMMIRAKAGLHHCYHIIVKFTCVTRLALESKRLVALRVCSYSQTADPSSVSLNSLNWKRLSVLTGDLRLFKTLFSFNLCLRAGCRKTKLSTSVEAGKTGCPIIRHCE